MARLIDTWNAGDHEEFLDELGPELEFSPDPSFPDAGTYRGDEFRRWMRDWIATWQENRFEMLGMTEFDQAILVDGRWHLGTRETGREVPLADFTIVLLYADEAAERPRRMCVFFDRAQALAVGEKGI
jgi:SnoaL-like protein